MENFSEIKTKSWNIHNNQNYIYPLKIKCFRLITIEIESYKKMISFFFNL